MPPVPSLPALGIDFGERRIGLALCAAGSRTAVPLTTLERHTDRAAVGHIASLARDHAAATLVVGEPRALDGARGDAAERVRRFGAKLAARTGLPVLYVGEALTSVEAEHRLAEAGVDVRHHRGRVDAVAAQILLQEALDGGLLAAADGGGAP